MRARTAICRWHDMNRSFPVQAWKLLLAGLVATASVSSFTAPAPPTARLSPEDLIYKGAFRFPVDAPGSASKWNYGGYAITYNPRGDAGAQDDGYPGSLFGVGHDHHEMVGEISIPLPRISQDRAMLPTATQLQRFGDITGGLRAATIPETSDVRGLQYLEPQPGQATPKLYWTIKAYYNASAQDYLSHGWSEVDLSAPESKGVWHLGPRNRGHDQPWHSMKTSAYIFDVPRAVADAHLGGRYLVSGRKHGTGSFGGSSGPSLYAFAPWKHAKGDPPAAGAEIEALPLLWYPTSDVAAYGFSVCDSANGGAWIAEGRRGVLIVGRRSLGAPFYGEPRPGDAERGKGWHCDPYEPQVVFYDPDELIEVARGLRKPQAVEPYARFAPTDLMPNCGTCDLSGAAYDRAHRLVYIVQYGGDPTGEVRPLVHVFQIAAAIGQTETR